MKGYIYISSAFTTVSRSKCGEKSWIDNDPHFWSKNAPPTWGICRTDRRQAINVGDYIFFVLPKRSELPQMIYGYFKVAEKITHDEAHQRRELVSKRMGNKNPNGNIIVTADGHYIRFDKGRHRDGFDEIRKHYVIGDTQESDFLSEAKIRRLAPFFLPVLNEVFKTNKVDIFKVISRGGRRLTEAQISQLLQWLRD